MKEKTLTIPESILKAENMIYDNSNSGLNATDAQAAIDEINSKSDIKVFTDSPMLNTHDGVLKINEIGGVHEQFSTTGKNVLGTSIATTTKSGVTCIDKDSSIFLLNGTATADLDFELSDFAVDKKAYEIKIFQLGGTYSGDIKLSALDNNWGNQKFVSIKDTYSTLETYNSYSHWRLQVTSGTVCSNLVVGLMVAEDVSDWEPYTGGIPSPNPNYPQEIKCVTGKNLLDCRGLTEQTVKGITYTPVYDNNGNLQYIEADGNATGDADYVVSSFTLLPGEEYIFSGCPSGGSTTTYRMGFTNVGNEYGSGVSYSSANQLVSYPFIRIHAGFTADHLRFYPMIRPASVTDGTYVPYGLMRIKTHRKNLVKSYRTNVISTDYGAILADAVANLKSGKTYTISADITAPTTTRAYWNKACGAFENSVNFYVSPGTNRYSCTFVSVLDGIPLKKAILSKFASGDGVEITADNLMIEEGEVATPYEPYTEHSITLSKPVNLYGKDSVKDLLTSKEIIEKYSKVRISGDWEWKPHGTGKGFYTLLSLGQAKVADGENGVFTHFLTGTLNNDQRAFFGTVGSDNVQLRYDDMTDVNALKTWLNENEVYGVYKLETPIIEPLPEIDQAALASLKTYDGVTYVEFDCSEVLPTFQVEASTTQEGAYVLDLMNEVKSVEQHADANTEMIGWVQEDILDIEESLRIPETTDTVLKGSYPGLIKINEISGAHEQFSTTGAQLFDKNTISSGAGISTSDGTLYASNYTFSTYYINVSNISSIAWNAKSSDTETWGAFYDENKNFIKGFNVKTLYVNIPNGAYYIRLTFLNEYLNTIMVNSGTEALPWEPYTGGKPSPSPEYPQPIKPVTGKNLLDGRGLEGMDIDGDAGSMSFSPYYDENGNLTHIRAFGTHSGMDCIYAIQRGELTLPKGTYKVNGVTGGSSTTYFAEVYKLVDNVATFVCQITNGDVEFTLDEDTSIFYRCVIKQGYDASVGVNFYPMIRPASVFDDTYVPYGLIRIKGHRKNFFKHTAISTTKNGIVTTVNADRSITMKGASTVEYTSSFVLGAIALPAGSYIATGCPSGGSSTTYCIRLGLGSNGETYLGTVAGEGYSFELTEEQIVEVRIHVNGKVTINETFYPMIREASIENSTYEPYTEHSITLSEPMEWYGNEDIQDLLTNVENVGKFGVEVFDGSDDEDFIALSDNRIGLDCSNVIRKPSSNKTLPNIKCTAFTPVIYENLSDTDGVFSVNVNGTMVFRDSVVCVSLETWKAHLQANPMTVVYELAESTATKLPTADQIALNSLQSFNGITYVEFDTEVQPTWKVEYPTSKENAYVIESLLTAKNNEARYNDLAAALLALTQQ